MLPIQAVKRIQSALKPPMNWAFTTCQAMCGNGAVMLMIKIIIKVAPLEILKARTEAIVFCVAARRIACITFAVLPCAILSRLRAVMIILDLGWWLGTKPLDCHLS